MEIKFLIVAVVLIGSIFGIYLLYEETAKEQKIQDSFGENPVYLAMKDRFPDASYSIPDNDLATGMSAHIVNSINGNDLFLTIHQGQTKWGNFPTSVTCRTANGVDTLETDDFVIDYIKSTDCLNLGEDPDLVYAEHTGQITKEEMMDIFEKHPAYLAMKKQFPDSSEEIEYFVEGGGKLRVHAINPENKNTLLLVITIDLRLDKIPAYASCIVRDDIFLQQQYSFLADYIAKTDCLEFTFPSDYVHPTYYGPVH